MDPISLVCALLHSLIMITFKAAILDLDGVVTHTAKIHALAWQRMFDEYSSRRAIAGLSAYEPFDPVNDYLLYVDGKARQDGAHSFLESRGIRLPLGAPSDVPSEDPAKETCHSLGNRKDRYFKQLLEKRGPEVFEDAVAAVKQWRSQGLRTAIASSSRNCAEILSRAGLSDLFDVRIDGTHLYERGLRGKPAPDLFVAAAEELEVKPEDAMLFEDAISGVEAGRRGGFGLVVGVCRSGPASSLLNAGAHRVVAKLTELLPETAGLRVELPALERRKKA